MRNTQIVKTHLAITYKSKQLRVSQISPKAFPSTYSKLFCNTQSKVLYIYIIHQWGTYIYIYIYIIHPSGTHIHHPSMRYIISNSCYLHGTNVSAVAVGTATRKAKGRKEGWMDGWMNGWMVDRKHSFFHWIPAP